MSMASSNYGGRDADEAEEYEDRVSELERRLMQRVGRLEEIVARQQVELDRLRRTSSDLEEVSKAFLQVIKILQDTGLQAESLTSAGSTGEAGGNATAKQVDSLPKLPERVVESFDDSMIFGTAPSSVIDAADSAGAAILAAMLAGKQRMLVDVRDAELSSDSETLVQFIELAILPIAAGLEGLKSARNRVKIVFPKVSQLLEYRRTMALAAPEVVALSTLGFDPVEKRDKLVVIVAPDPDDEEGLLAMKELLVPSDPSRSPIQQPLVILNYHMVPVAHLPADFETAYHLRLLTVQYMSGSDANDYFQQFQEGEKGDEEASAEKDPVVAENSVPSDPGPVDASDGEDNDITDDALEAAMKHAHEVGMNQGVTRAMVIRAYPRPWHVFVDTSPDTDADFEVAATFDDEPTLDELNLSIVECLEGSEREDEIVAQQMQHALEEGQLDQVSDMIGEALNQFEKEIEEVRDDGNGTEEDDEQIEI